MFELNDNMKVNAAKIFTELIKSKYDESVLLPILKDMGRNDCYTYDTIDDINGSPVECYFNTINIIDSQAREDGYDVDRQIVIIVTADEKAMLAEMTVANKFALKNGVFDIEDSFATAREISIAEALELWKD